jgi:hypothetical protein
MFVLRYLPGQKKTSYRDGVRELVDVGGEYIRHTGTYDKSDGSTPNTTKDLQRAKVYNTAAGARCNWEAQYCEVVEVRVELA